SWPDAFCGEQRRGTKRPAADRRSRHAVHVHLRPARRRPHHAGRGKSASVLDDRQWTEFTMDRSQREQQRADGTYCYTLKFNLPPCTNANPTYTVTGQWMADDAGTIYLNGNPT